MDRLRVDPFTGGKQKMHYLSAVADWQFIEFPLKVKELRRRVVSVA